MKNRVKLVAGLLTTLVFAVSLLANAGDSLNYQVKVPADVLQETPNFIVLNLYVSEDDAIPIASQTYFPNEWDVNKTNDGSFLQLSMEDVSYVKEYESVWAETEVDGVVVTPRVQILVTAPGISVGGMIESRNEGFKFPDTSVQTTAGISSSDLSAHTANASAHHSPNVTSANIVDGTIVSDDVYQLQNFTLRGLTTTAGDMRFNDSWHGLRYYDDGGTTQRAYIESQSPYWTFRHTEHSNRPILHSNADGIGIGTSTPSATHAVTMPSLEVTGNLEIGWTRVNTSYAVDNSTTCHSHGNLTCYYGSGTVSCPVGTKVLGGRSSGTSVAYGNLSRSYPNSDTSWTCTSTYDISVSWACYAICARLE